VLVPLDENGNYVLGYGELTGKFAHKVNEQIFDSLEKGHSYIEGTQKKIMVTHVHPSGSLIERFTHFFPGSGAVRDAIERFQPDLALCGHVHEAEGIEEKIGKTKLINVGRHGKIIEI